MSWNRVDLALGILFLVLSLVTLFVWIPLDIETGMLEKVRRRMVVGDAFLPTLLAIAMALLALALIAGACRGPRVTREDEGLAFEETGEPLPVGMRHVKFVGGLVLLFVICFTLMVFGGPLTVSVINSAGGDIGDYRSLRDTIPFKYIGFILGGTLLVYAPIAWIDRNARKQGLLIALAGVGLLIFFYDIPFDHLLLPPNGDQ